MTNWTVMTKRADFNRIAEEFHIDPVTARLIRNRDVIEMDEIRQYLYGGIEDLGDPHLLKDGDLLASILEEKIKQGKKIRVIGDYDIDGVMATYILVTGLKMCNAQVSMQIPDRIHDGYGLNKSLIEVALADGIDTILTCDNGIAAMDEIAYAVEKGMTVLVTDHHEIPYETTEEGRVYKRSIAQAIVNPHQQECGYPYKYLCGAAVAWKVICLLYEKMGLSYEMAQEFLENVAFATVGDIMPLTGENRILVKLGLKKIRNTKNIGLRALIAQCGLNKEAIGAYDFGFVLGPCINATGRLDTAKRALELLFATDAMTAAQIANELVILNTERKDLTQEGVEAAIAFYEAEQMEKDKVIVLFLPDVHESIAGIIAGRIRERYYKPTFVLTRAEQGAKGSGRSTENYSMYEEMCKCADLFTKFGGHPMAAGLSLSEENIPEFRRKINENCTLTEDDMIPKVRIDVPMPMDYVTKELIQEFAVLEPFGKDNTKPVFADKDLRVQRLSIIGKNRNVVKMTLVSSQNHRHTGICFKGAEELCQYIEERFGKEQLERAMMGQENHIVLSFVYYPRINVYQNIEELQFEIQHYR